ncbi:MAG: hypothetical protein EKK41_28815 [Hyphomicrobiales bacterium]|nr:MAG: hypothetical protein EKK41_28815 [Hyphomicrobiales bacterium]
MTQKKRRFNRRFSRLRKSIKQTALNYIGASIHPKGALRDRRTLLEFRSKLAAAARIRKPIEGQSYLHFVYGFKDRHEFPFYAYMAVRSAQFHNRDWPVFIHVVYEPTGPWWEKLLADPTVMVIKIREFDYFGVARFYHYAHKSDIVRLLALHDVGGVYLDIDTITARSFSPLLEHEFGMAVQASIENSAAGLCNAVMWGKRNSHFSNLWIKQYRYFKSKGRDSDWDFHSVRLPWILTLKHAGHISILDHRAFFNPLWPEAVRVLFSGDGIKFWEDLQDAYGFHLWNGLTEKTLKTVGPDYVRNSTSVYARLARPVLEAFK